MVFGAPWRMASTGELGPDPDAFPGGRVVDPHHVAAVGGQRRRIDGPVELEDDRADGGEPIGVGGHVVDRGARSQRRSDGGGKQRRRQRQDAPRGAGRIHAVNSSDGYGRAQDRMADAAHASRNAPSGPAPVRSGNGLRRGRTGHGEQRHGQDRTDCDRPRSGPPTHDVNSRHVPLRNRRVPSGDSGTSVGSAWAAGRVSSAAGRRGWRRHRTRRRRRGDRCGRWLRRGRRGRIGRWRWGRSCSGRRRRRNSSRWWRRGGCSGRRRRGRGSRRRWSRTGHAGGGGRRRGQHEVQGDLALELLDGGHGLLALLIDVGRSAAGGLEVGQDAEVAERRICRLGRSVHRPWRCRPWRWPARPVPWPCRGIPWLPPARVDRPGWHRPVGRKPIDRRSDLRRAPGERWARHHSCQVRSNSSPNHSSDTRSNSGP